MGSFINKVGMLEPLYGEDGKPMYNKFLWYRIPLFRYSNGEPKLTYINPYNVQYQMDDHFNTDGGSIPPLLRLTPFIHLDPFNFPRSYLFHDQIFQYGGAYIKLPDEEKFLFRLMTRNEANILLENMLPLDGATEIDICAIVNTVDFGSIFIWDKKRKPVKQREARKLAKINVYDYTGSLIEDNGGM